MMIITLEILEIAARRRQLRKEAEEYSLIMEALAARKMSRCRSRKEKPGRIFSRSECAQA